MIKVMKRPASRTRASLKSKSSLRTVDDYLSAVPETARTTLNKVRATIRAALAAECTEVISYGIPAFKHEKVLVWYAAFADHCSLFPTASVIDKFEDRLKNYRISKGTIRFAIDKPLPASLLKKMVKARFAEIKGKQR